LTSSIAGYLLELPDAPVMIASNRSPGFRFQQHGRRGFSDQTLDLVRVVFLFRAVAAQFRQFVAAGGGTFPFRP